MPFNVLYIDDEPIDRSQAYADGLSGEGLIKIIVEKPTRFEELVAELVSKQESFDALILDLKLDGNQQGERTATYTAPSLASGIRSKFFNDDGFKNEFPIFLISSSGNLKKYYDPDSASHDLFDLTFTKTSIADCGFQHERMISSIISAYNTIKEGKTIFSNILGIPSIDYLDDRILTTKFLTGEGTSVSEISQFILNEVILKSGILINQTTLAARLGIDYRKSEDWVSLLKILETSEYTGVFCSSIKRWWANDLISWWNKNFTNISLIRLSASERVKLIKEKFNLEQIVEASPINKTTSSKYWTICQALKLPLDPKDGFIIDGNHLYPWQDKRYLSLEAILEREAKRLGLSIHPAEKERFEALKEEYM